MTLPASPTMPKPVIQRLSSGLMAGLRLAISRGVWSIIFLTIGVLCATFGLLAAAAGFGLPFLAIAPLWFILAAALRPTRPRIILACVVIGFWTIGVVDVLVH